ncbi:hypothetical protein [Natrinema sp. J7-1]|uniref:hypothetical protein n=1 Tax=Natrinema sp. J7-1 TaxID=1172566 RepID=UPI0006779CA5|nr:hypothetical protein [Natrinema sp. J7-1]
MPETTTFLGKIAAIINILDKVNHTWMKINSKDGSITRRSVLKNGVAATTGLALASGAASADSSSGTITLEAWFADSVSPNVYDNHFVPAGETIASQTSVGVEFDGYTNTTNQYNGSYTDLFDQFRDNHGSEFDDGKIHVLFYNQAPNQGAPAVHADKEYASDSKPVAVVNMWTKMPGLDENAFPNTIITGILRPLLTPHDGKAPESNMVNSFGTQYTGTIPIHDTYVSPMATWHTPSNAACWNPGDLEDEDDNVNALCGGKDPRANCQCSTDLSDCTKKWVEHHMENDY